MARGRAPLQAGDLLERSDELEQIDQALRDAIAGEGRVLLIEGPPGIGKTSLLGAARRSAQQSAMEVLAARGGELEGNFPHGVVRQLFGPLLSSANRASAPARAELLAGAARFAAPVLSGEAEPSAVDDAGPDAVFAALHGLYWLTVNLSLRAPALLVVDDAQWADGPSLRFLLFLARRLEGVAAVLLVSTRSGERGGELDLAGQLATEPSVRTITPSPLSERAIARLLTARLEQTPDHAFTAACRAATRGTPCLVHALAAALVADGIPPTAAQALLAQRARDELAASGARLRRLRVTGRDALTPSELRVARLAAEGRTNNEVAQALFVTPKTVDTHLSHVYTKLGISSRHDLAAAFETAPEAAREVAPGGPATAFGGPF